MVVGACNIGLSRCVGGDGCRGISNSGCKDVCRDVRRDGCRGVCGIVSKGVIMFFYRTQHMSIPIVKLIVIGACNIGLSRGVSSSGCKDVYRGVSRYGCKGVSRGVRRDGCRGVGRIVSKGVIMVFLPLNSTCPYQ